MKYFIKTTIVCMLLSVLSGCATMVQKSATNLLYVNSDPPGAQVTLSTGVKGITPCQFELPGKSKLMVVIEKEGYEQQEVFVEAAPTLRSVVLSGLAAGGGSPYHREPVYEFKPNPIEVKLKRKKNPAQ